MKFIQLHQDLWKGCQSPYSGKFIQCNESLASIMKRPRSRPDHLNWMRSISSIGTNFEI